MAEKAEKAEKKRSDGKGGRSSSDHVKHANRFLDFCATVEATNGLRVTAKQGNKEWETRVNVRKEFKELLLKRNKRFSDASLPRTTCMSWQLLKAKKPASAEAGKKKKADDDGLRLTLPAPIIAGMQLLSEEKRLWPNSSDSSLKQGQLKIPITWISCFLADVRPDQTRDGWKFFECSHRCVNSRCFAAAHLVWESKRVNQSRGHTVDCCRKKCNHCERILCLCQNIHTPACLVSTATV